MNRKGRQSNTPALSEALISAMSRAKSFHMEGKFAEAQKLYLKVLDNVPEYPEALYLLGVLRYQHNRDLNGAELVKRSIELSPQRADWHNTLGNIYLVEKNFSLAVESFKNSIDLVSDDANAWNNMGAALQQLNRFGDAEAAYRKAVELNPDFIPALNNLGALLSAQGRHAESAGYLCKAIVLSPGENQSKLERGAAFYKLGRIEEAAEVYRQWTIEEPENPIAAHLYTACSGVNASPRASDAFIEAKSDEYAAQFDVKMEQLSYAGPALIAAALAKETAPAKRFDSLDAGCGTGLCASVLKLFSRHLTGVDLSASMLKEAAKRGLYDELVKDELTGYMLKHTARFDLIAAADTLIYFGALEEVVAAAWGALRPKGLMVFTVESSGDDTDTPAFSLNPHGRYSHRRDYVSAVLKSCAFDVVSMQPATLRKEWGEPVNCLVVTARKMADDKSADGKGVFNSIKRLFSHK
ncbi:MAG: tetratricopeptide repeat protein [Nitrospirae bacterium]|nr:tetratricopeptide repeat protein [Nitrospirota bacterium]